MKVLFDSNLWISFMIGKRLSSLADVVSGDKDLTDLGNHAGIPILKYSEFLDQFNSKS